MKRAFDITTASVGPVLLSPLLLFVSFLVKLDSSGAALFRYEAESLGHCEDPEEGYVTRVPPEKIRVAKEDLRRFSLRFDVILPENCAQLPEMGIIGY